MQLETILQQIGLTKKEAKIYLSLLDLGEANLKQIADLSGIARTSLYEPVKNLIAKGVVDFYKKKDRKIYVAVPPEKLLRTSESNLKVLEDNMERFKNKMNSKYKKPNIKFYEGPEGIKLIFKEILAEKRPLLAITCVEDMNKIAHKDFGNFIQDRSNQGLHVKLLTNRSPQSEKLKKTDAEELRETRFVPREYKFNTANYMFGNKTALLSLKQEPVMGILMDDEAITETQKMYFELIWKMASKI